MVIAVSVIVLGALVTVLAVVTTLTRRLWRWATSDTAGGAAPSTRPGLMAYGRLHTPADPVGTLGSLAPDADLSTDLTDPSDLYGD